MTSHSSCTQSSVPLSPDLQQDFNSPSPAPLDIFPSDPSPAMQNSTAGISSIPAYSPTQFSHPPPPPLPTHQHQSVSTVFSAVPSAHVVGTYEGPSLSPHQFRARPATGLPHSLHIPPTGSQNARPQSRPPMPSVGNITTMQPAFSTSCFRLTPPHQSSMYSWVAHRHRQQSMGATSFASHGTQYYRSNFPEQSSYPFPPGGAGGDYAGMCGVHSIDRGPVGGGFYWPQTGMHQMRVQRLPGIQHPPSASGGVIPRIPTHTILHPPGAMPRSVGKKAPWWPQHQGQGGGDCSGSTAHTILHPPGATPMIQYSGATPTIQYSGATPTIQYSPGATPTVQYSGAMPTVQYSGATPTIQYSGATPMIPPGSMHTIQHSPGATPTIQYSGATPMIPPGSMQHSPGATPTIQHPGATPTMQHPSASHRPMLLPSLPGHAYSNQPSSPVLQSPLPCFRPTDQPTAVTRPTQHHMHHVYQSNTRQSASEQQHTQQVRQHVRLHAMSQLQQISQMDFTAVSAERYLGVEERTIEFVENNPLCSPCAHSASSSRAHQQEMPQAQHDLATSASTSQQLCVAASTPQSTRLELHTAKRSLSRQHPAQEREEEKALPAAQETAESMLPSVSIARLKPVYATPHTSAPYPGLSPAKSSPGPLSTVFTSNISQRAASTPMSIMPRAPPSAVSASPVASAEEGRCGGVKRTPTAVKRKPRPSGGAVKKQRKKPLTTHSKHTSPSAPPAGSSDGSLMVSYPMKALIRGDVEISEQEVEVTESELTDVQLYVDFAKHFKSHHLALGYSLEDIAQQVAIRYGNKIPLQYIRDFEDLQLRKDKFIPLMSVLNRWMEDTAQASGSSDVPVIMTIPATSIYPQRTRRQKTMVSTSVTLRLEEEFSKKRTPTQSELQKLALDLGVEKEYVRSWFCNRRKKEKCLGKRPARKPEPCVSNTSLMQEVAVDIGSGDGNSIKIPSQVYDITVEVPSIHPRDLVNSSDCLHYTATVEQTTYTLPQCSEWHVMS